MSPVANDTKTDKGDRRERGSRTDGIRRARKKREAHRWLREARAIAAFVVAAFVLVALATYRPPSVDAYGPSGPLGHWVARGLFEACGYAAFLFPLLRF